MKAAKEAVRANPKARALMKEARAWKGEDWDRPKHYPSEDHQGLCPCDFCGQEIKERMGVTTTLISKMGRRSGVGECLVFNHGEKNTILHTEIWRKGKRLD